MALTRRAVELRSEPLMLRVPECDPNRGCTRVTAVEGRCPRPLDDRVRKSAQYPERIPFWQGISPALRSGREFAGRIKLSLASATNFPQEFHRSARNEPFASRPLRDSGTRTPSTCRPVMEKVFLGKYRVATTKSPRWWEERRSRFGVTCQAEEMGHGGKVV